MAFFIKSVFVYFLHLCVASADDRIHYGQKVVIQSANGSTVDGLLRYNLESDILTCINECKIRPYCQFINYHRLLLQCDLLRSEIATESVVFTTSPGYVYGNKDEWSLNTPCHGCGMFETCEATSLSFQCSIKECGIPPVFPSSVVIGNMHTVGSRNAYECTQYKAMTIYTTHISECLPNGTWSNPDFVCLDTDECISDPCQQDGTCVDGINEYTCTCASGWQGTNCENDINECVSDPCLNAGTCIDGENQYSCTCVDGWSGSNCQINIDECIDDPCLHDGTCVDGINEYTCTCASGWQGTNCGNDINECVSDPCLNAGTCKNGENQYSCTCVDGWSGINCQRNIDECIDDPCLHDGTCVDGINEYTCTCASGWQGTNCENDINECGSNPCLNAGTCINGENQYTCTCVDGWSGRNCQTNIDECDSNPCKNGGTCTDNTNGYTCSCTNNWTGGHCQTGQCMSGWSSYMTSCYKLNDFRLSNNDAENECSTNGAHLADVSSMAEMDFLKDLYLASHNTQDIDGIWLSPNDIAVEDQWRLSDNTIATFLNWANGQPDKQFDYDDCVQVWPATEFQWNDVKCSYSFWFYCEYEL